MCSRKPLPRVVWAFVIRSDASKTSQVIKFVHNFACANAQFKYCLLYFRSGVSKNYFECTQEVRYGVLDCSIDLRQAHLSIRECTHSKSCDPQIKGHSHVTCKEFRTNCDARKWLQQACLSCRIQGLGFYLGFFAIVPSMPGSD